MSDAVFATRLDACSLLEASAGTGKTYALAGLFVRAVIVGRLAVPQVLAVTYTVAATQELHARVRLRLQQAHALAMAWRDGDPSLRAHDRPETALLRRLLHQALHEPVPSPDGAGDAARGESLPALRGRLARAVRDMDLAAISTIHGFCQRVLAEHALETGQPLLAVDLETRDNALRMQLAVDLWRTFAADDDGAAFLRRAFGDLASLARTLDALLAAEPLLPAAPEWLPPDPSPAVATAWRELRREFDAAGADLRAALLAAIDDKVLNNAQYRPAHVDALWTWCATHAPGMPPSQCHEKLAKYTAAALRSGTSKAGVGRTPQAPWFDAVAAYLEAHATLCAWQEARDLQQLHALRQAARTRDAARKQALNVRNYDDLIGTVHAATGNGLIGPGLGEALREQFPLVLVDEFQDTDARQWAIFDRLFGNRAHANRAHDSSASTAGGLVLVGDPKQAIYRFRGGDVHTYRRAADASLAGPLLLENFRSRPCVLAAVDALFGDVGPDALGDGIAYRDAIAGGAAGDGDLQCEGKPEAAIAFRVVPAILDAGGRARDRNKDESIATAAALCADAIRDRLLAARAGRALRREDGALRPIEPRDCAVLVRTHAEAQAVRAALARRGVPAVATGKGSLFDGEEAQELLTLLLALRGAGDDRRLRAALATRLLGQDAAAIAALDDDGAAARRWQEVFDGWRTRWERHGTLALLTQVVADNAVRLLAAADGERRITNLMQLAELMQEGGARSRGTQGQLDWLRSAIAAADPEDEAQQPRLESDAGRVQVLTLHKSKGLEFPLVYLPFAGIGRLHEKPKQVAMYSLDGQRVRQWTTSGTYDGAPPWSEASARHVAEERAEDLRLLYVGLTRARDALWICCGALASHGNTALARLLGGGAPSPALLARLGANAVVEAGDASRSSTRLPPLPAPAVPPARQAQRRLQRDWWTHSFSQLHRQPTQGALALVDDAPADDERPTAATRELADGGSSHDRRFAGARFGNVLHHALEHADFGAWRDHRSAAAPPAQREVLLDALRSEGYRDADIAAGERELVPLVARTLNAVLPGGVRLCDLPAADRIAEMEFHFALRGATARALLDLLHAHGMAKSRHDFGGWPVLAGLMHGKIDLVYRHAGRVHVLDYKSNRLDDYSAGALAQAMDASEYDLQALLYAVAVQRWLRSRLGGEYAYDRHFGGAVYIFCRGLDADHPTRGLHVPALTRELLDAAEHVLATSMRGAT